MTQKYVLTNQVRNFMVGTYGKILTKVFEYAYRNNKMIEVKSFKFMLYAKPKGFSFYKV